MNLITFENTNGELIIRMPHELLVWAAENNPETPLMVRNKETFCKQVLFQLEHNLGDEELGLTGLQILLDNAYTEVAISGDNCCEFKEAE